MFCQTLVKLVSTKDFIIKNPHCTNIHSTSQACIKRLY